MLVHLLCSKKSQSRLLKVSGKGFEEFLLLLLLLFASCTCSVERDMGVCGIGLFSCGISVIVILTYGIEVSSSSAVCDFSSFWLTVFGTIRLFTVLRYRLFAPSFRYHIHNKTQ